MSTEVNNSIGLRKQRKEIQCGDSEESLDEFLEHELLCWLNEDKPIGEEVAAIRPELYGELNNLLDVVNEADNRCVEEILHEAELLMKDAQGTERTHSPFQWNEALHGMDEMTPTDRNRMFDFCVQTVIEFGFPANHNSTSERKYFGPKPPPEETLQAVPVPVPVNDEGNGILHKESSPATKCIPASKGLRQNTDVVPCREVQLPECEFRPTPIRSEPEAIGRQMCDKFTQPSPTGEEREQYTPVKEMPNPYGSYSKERLLEGKITELQERLKDTEERYQSLKLQYDTLSQVHRTLRDNYGTIQEESEKLQFDIQHLTKCADVLRSELQAARCDRDSAIELQKILQSELDESRKEKKKLQDSNEKDTKNIQDLQRQCREMERILMRKNPDSVSALIVACKSPTGKPDPESASSTCRLLEQRIAQLEADARKQDAKAQGILADVQARFNSVQAKYETHIADLEMQVLSLQEINSKLNEKIIRQMEELASISSHAITSSASLAAKNSTASFTQTDMSQSDDAFDRARKREGVKMRSILVQTDAEHAPARQQQPQQQQQSSAKRAQAQSKEDAHLLATIRGMRVDLAIKEKAVQRLTRELDECKKTIKKLQKKKETPTSKGDCGRSPVKVRNKAVDAPEADCIGALRDAQSKVKVLEMDYRALQDKRLQDLKTLQAAHEKELASCHESIRFLQQRLTESEEELLHRKDKQRPNHSNDYYGLKAKVAYLERRHTEREQRLLMLVEALSK